MEALAQFRDPTEFMSHLCNPFSLHFGLAGIEVQNCFNLNDFKWHGFSCPWSTGIHQGNKTAAHLPGSVCFVTFTKLAPSAKKKKGTSCQYLGIRRLSKGNILISGQAGKKNGRSGHTGSLFPCGNNDLGLL